MDTACKKYGWTLDYVLWGVSYLNLQMMQADEVAIFTDYTGKQGGTQEVLKGDDPANTEAILSQIG